MSRNRKNSIKKSGKTTLIQKILSVILVCIWTLLLVFAITAWKFPQWYENIVNPGKNSEMTHGKDVADQYLRAGNYINAIENYTIAKSIVPDDVGVNTNLGIAYSKTGDFPHAISTFRFVLTLDPDLIDVIYYNLADSYNSMGMLDSSIHYFELSAKTAPFPFYPWRRLGNILRNNRMLLEAASAYEKALDNRLDMKNSYIGMLKRDKYLFDDEPETEALIDSILRAGVENIDYEHYDNDIFERLLNNDRDLASLHNDLGVIYGMLGMPEKAEPNFRQSVKINPSDQQAQQNHLLCQQELNNRESEESQKIKKN